jgi:phosphoglycolate phosphatase-like HAD superfamily hydrolase
MLQWTQLSKYVDEVKGLSGNYDRENVEFKTDSIFYLKSKYYPERTFMIGDQEEDMMAGNNANAVTVFYSPERKTTQVSNFVISDLEDLCKIL